MFVNIGHFIAEGLKTGLNYIPKLQKVLKPSSISQYTWCILIAEGLKTGLKLVTYLIND